MGDEERKNRENPLSREGWIMFLNSEISNFENKVHQFSVVILALISMFIAIMSLVISSIFSTASVIPEPAKSYILYNIYYGYEIIQILIYFFIVFSIYQMAKFLIKRKIIKRIEDIRNDILEERLTDTNEIRERWRNLMQARSFTEKLVKIDKMLDAEKHSSLFTKIINEQQPIAFLISVSLVLAAFFDKNNDGISQTYAIFASLSFFLAYLWLAFHKIFNSRLFFYWGLFLTLFSVILIYYSFGGALTLIFGVKDKIIAIFAVYIVYSVIVVPTIFLLGKSNKNSLMYKICNPVFWITVLFILIYVPIGISRDLTPIPTVFAFLLLSLIFIMSALNAVNKR